MQIRLGSQSGNRPPKSGHHVVWEKVPGEISISGPLPRATSVQQDPFPEFLKEEWFSDQSSLLREMNDAVVALSKELKLQGPADPVPAGDVSLRPWEDTTMHGTAPGALQETLASLSSQETLQGDLLQEGPAQAALGAQDVTPADLQRLGILGQEQVSTQADKVRPDVAPEQLLPKEKPLRVMESEQIAAEHPELPKEKVPPASTLCARVRREEHMGSDPVGAFLGDSLLSDVANSRTQPLTRLSGEPGNGLDVGQRDGKQDVRLQTSQEVKPSPEDPGAVMADGARSSAGVTPETWPDPDHLYNVLFVGDSHVGKTSFLYRLHANSFNPHLTATVGLDYQIKNLIVDNKLFALRLWDSAGQERYHSITKQFFRKADGVVLMYDITSEYSFADVRYWLSCIQEGAEDGIAILLLGNKTDCAAERQVPTKEGERLAQEHQLTFYECSAASGHNVSESMVSLIRLLKIRDDQLKSKVEEEPKPTQKKKGCC
nr:PREDICTED: ras-related protein Rab-44 isoform X3 [Struthio camelus australis]